LIRLDVNGSISFASPNAKSAFSRMGWHGELEGHNLGEVAEKVVTASPNAQEEGIRTRLNGKTLRRVEIDNDGATIDLLVLPLIQVQIELDQSFCCKTLQNFVDAIAN